MSRIFITGAAGFIGSHLVEACLADGHEIHIVVRPGSNDGRIRRFGGAVVRHSFDLQSEQALKHCLADVLPEVIFHLAARPRRPEDSEFADVKDGIRDYLQGTASLLCTAAGLRVPPVKVIRVGSLAEYGSAPAPYREEMREEPVSTYGAELAAATHLVAGLRFRLPFPVVTARLALVYGACQSAEYLVPHLIQQCLAQEPSFVRHPQDRRDLLHVDDVTDALRAMVRAPLGTATLVNISSGIAPTMRDVARLIVELTGADPGLVTYGSAHQSSGVADLRGAPDLAQTLFGWRPRTALAEGLARTVDWYRDRHISQTFATTENGPEPSHEHRRGVSSWTT